MFGHGEQVLRRPLDSLCLVPGADGKGGDGRWLVPAAEGPRPGSRISAEAEPGSQAPCVRPLPSWALPPHPVSTAPLEAVLQTLHVHTALSAGGLGLFRFEHCRS